MLSTFVGIIGVLFIIAAVYLAFCRLFQKKPTVGDVVTYAGDISTKAFNIGTSGYTQGWKGKSGASGISGSYNSGWNSPPLGYSGIESYPDVKPEPKFPTNPKSGYSGVKGHSGIQGCSGLKS